MPDVNSFQYSLRDVRRERVGIEGRAADHRQHFAGARIERHHRAALAFERQFRDRLQIQIERQLQVVAGRGLGALEHFALAAGTIHHHAALAVDAHQHVVILALEAGFADDVALRIFRELGSVQLLLGDLADVADGVRGEAIARIQAPLVLDQFHFRVTCRRRDAIRRRRFPPASVPA